MAPTKLCEIYSDLLALEKLPEVRDEQEYHGDTRQFQEDQRKHDEVVAANQTQRLFYNAVRYLLERDYRFDDKALPAPTDDNDGLPAENRLDNLSNNNDRAQFLTIAGAMLADGFRDPTAGKTALQLSEAAGDVISNFDKGAKPKLSNQILISASFVRQMVKAFSEYKTNAALFNEVHRRLLKVSTVERNGTDVAQFEARQLTEIGRQLIKEGISAKDAQLGPRFERALATALSGAAEGRSSAIDVDLPDLEEGTESDIIVDNVNALSAVYFAAMLEELKFFSVMDKVAEQFMKGALPVSRGTGGDRLYDYIRNAPNRLSEVERRELYARSFGLAQGSVEEAMPNREFNDLWIRFLSAVSFNNREKDSTERRLTSEEQVFKSGRDLAVNLSLHGYGLAHFAAIELQNHIKFIKESLSTRDILQAYGVRDIWQLVERNSNMYLGGAVNSVRQRTMAQAGSRIIQWLASQAGTMTSTSRRLVLTKEIQSYSEQWLAVTGTPDTTVERFSEPVALQQQRTIPDFGQLASGEALRDALANMGNLTNGGNLQLPQA